MPQHCKCNTLQGNKIASFLRDFGDNIPESDIKEATKKSKLSKWHAICDCKTKRRIMSAGRWDKSDWYLCTIKNVATDKDFRGQGLGKEIVKKAMEQAIDEGCLVLAADVTVDNIPSRKIFEDLKFRKVNTFCWRKGEKPANILHYVKIPPTGDRC